VVDRSSGSIVYKSGLNFHTIIPYLDLLTHSGLVVRTEGTIRDDRQGRSSARAQCREVERLVWAGTDEEKLIS